MKLLYTPVLFFVLTISFANAQPCSDLFISEYQEGSSYNKVIEIFNPTNGTIDLSSYELQTYFNGSDTPIVMHLNGLLASNAVWVGCHHNADSAVLQLADTTNSFVINWNGNDAVVLLNTVTGDTLDVIGVVGDSVTNWSVGSGSTQDHTLVRMVGVQEGTSDWSVGSSQWDVYPQNDFTHLGSHLMTPCAVLPDPEIHFILATDTVLESTGVYSIEIGIVNPNASPTSVDVSVAGGSATNGSDYNFTTQTVTFPGGSSANQTADVSIIDDALTEGIEQINFQLSNATNNASVTGSNFKLEIIDNDPASIASFNQSSLIRLLPNPTSGIVSVVMKVEANKIAVKNILGEEIISLNPSANTVQLDLTSFPEGVYCVEIDTNDGVISKKLVKE